MYFLIFGQGTSVLFVSGAIVSRRVFSLFAINANTCLQGRNHVNALRRDGIVIFTVAIFYFFSFLALR